MGDVIQVRDGATQKRLEPHTGPPLHLLPPRKQEGLSSLPEVTLSEIAAGEEVKFLHRLTGDSDVGEARL